MRPAARTPEGERRNTADCHARVTLVDERHAGLTLEDHELTDRGQDLVDQLGIDLAALCASRRVFAPACVDWTDRRVHLAGALPAAITSVFLDRGWLAHGPGRGLRVDDDFDDNIEKWLAI